MKAAVCRAFAQDLSIEAIDLGDPQAGEVSVKILACAICHSDITYIDGGWGGDLPSIYGHEAVGVVDRVGAGVTDFVSGDRVVVTLIRSCKTCWQCANKNEVLCETHFDLDSRENIHDLKGEHLFQGLRTGAFAENCVV
ncbi:MAG: alcohol dehydrogenase catalytic domain-containing protein, partial [Pseudomonadota bacterium]